MTRQGGNRRVSSGSSSGRSGGRRFGAGHVLAGLALVVILISGAIVWSTLADGCGGNRKTVSVMTDSDMAGVVKDLAGQASDNSCYDYRVSATPNIEAPSKLTGNSRTDLWLADSPTRARRVIQQVRLQTDYVSKSLASSPVMVVGTTLRESKTWVDVMRIENLQVGNPLESATGDAPIVGGVASVATGQASPTGLKQAMVTMVTTRLNLAPGQDTDEARLKLADSSVTPVVASEQQYLAYLRTHKTSKLTAQTPRAGTVALTYPLLNTADSGRKDIAAKAGAALVAAAATDKGRKAINDAGYRNPDGSGVGDDVPLLKYDDETQIDKALASWQTIGVPTRTLQVLDTSGSMRTPAGNSTRAQLLADATVEGIKLPGRNAQIGTWIFGIDKGGKGQDWREITPVKRLDDMSTGTLHRDLVTRTTLAALKNDLGGGTGLYDSTLAAYKHMVDTYDPAATNAIVIATDGRNEDAQSITLDDLIGQLKALYDPARPVQILTLGLTDDADADALKKIADAVGGVTYIARTPSDIKNIFTSERIRMMD